MANLGVYLPKARKLTPEQMTADFFALDFRKASWSPKMFVLHNTGAPTLKEWMGAGATPEQRLANLSTYYKGMGWHSAPHWFVAPDAIWEFCNPLQDGVHCSCANHIAFGAEMVGDYSTEAFDTGPGAQVRDNAVHLIATVFKKFGWQPDPLSLWGHGLAFHKDCAQDHHNCPGKNVDRSDIVKRVLAAMEALPAVTKVPPATTPPTMSVSALQDALNRLGATPELVVDGQIGAMTRTAIRVYQRVHNLPSSGQPDAVTIASLQAGLTKLG